MINTSTDVCRNHLARSEKEFQHTNISKLSRNDLEDLYYNVIETNQFLKRSVNDKSEKLKLLSTKLLRVSASQRSHVSKEQNKCCAGNVALIYEQNQTISDLKNASERMSEKIRLLNMKLCSARQFSKTSSNKCNRCGINRKHSSLLLSVKRSDTNLHSPLASTHFTGSAKNSLVISVATNTDPVTVDAPDGSCRNNKCRTLLNECTEKALNLEQEVQALREARALGGEREARAASRLAAAEAANCDLHTQLSIEKRKVAELEVEMKSAQVTSEVVKVIEEHLCNQLNSDVVSNMPLRCRDCQRKLFFFNESNENAALVSHGTSTTDPDINFSTDKLSKCGSTPVKGSDDSGYVEGNRSSAHVFDGSMILKKMTEELHLENVTVDECTDSIKSSNVSLVAPYKSPHQEKETVKVVDKSDLPVDSIKVNVRLKSLDNDEFIIDKDYGNEKDNFMSSVLNLSDEEHSNLAEKELITQDENNHSQVADRDNEQNVESTNTSAVIENELVTRNKYQNKEVTDKGNRIKAGLTSPSKIKNIRNKIAKKQEIKPKQHEITTKQPDVSAVKKDKIEPIVNSKAHSITKTKISQKKDFLTAHNNKHKTKVQSDANKIDDNAVSSKDITCNPIVSATQAQRTQDGRKASPSIHATYSVGIQDGGERAISPDNTDYDVSSISDSSAIKCKRSPSEPLSLGEDRGTFTDTSSFIGTISSSEYGYLSEGEIPLRKGTNLSVGEQYIKRLGTTNMSSVPHVESASQVVELVRRELELCRRLARAKPPPTAHTQTKQT